MVDLAISEQFGLIWSEKLLATKPISYHSAFIWSPQYDLCYIGRPDHCGRHG